MASTDRVRPLGTEKYAEGFAHIQNELFEQFQRSNQQWAERLQTEFKLFADLGTKLSAARSIPDAAAAYQSYANQHMVMASEDARHLFEDYQALVLSGAHLWRTNWPARQGAIT